MYHFAWGTKYRKHIWSNTQTKEKVIAIFRTIADQYDITMGEAKCLSDHVHFVVGAPPRITPAHIVQILKSLSTKMLFKEYPWLKQHYWGGEVWVTGYFVKSIGQGLTKEQIERYVREQSEEF